MVLSELGELDATFSIIDGLLLTRGPLVTHAPPPARQGAEYDPQWRQTQWMFTPATNALRADPRFATLCDVIGLTKFWRQRGDGPDESLRLV